jgi:GNAT superfamily N-acetyltransferase
MMQEHPHHTSHALATVSVSNCHNDADELVRRVESECWPPWLRFESKHFVAHQQLFPEGQFRLYDDDGRPYASLSCTRMEWDEVIGHLPSWDAVAGPSLSFVEQFAHDGNALVPMSMSVRRDHAGAGVARELMKSAIERASDLGADYVIADFRPSGYGQAKRAAFTDFVTYVTSGREDRTPVDPWLRVVQGLGFRLCKIDATAMVVKASRRDVESWMRDYNPNSWWRVSDSSIVDRLLQWHAPTSIISKVDEVWECGETGI